MCRQINQSFRPNSEMVIINLVIIKAKKKNSENERNPIKKIITIFLCGCDHSVFFFFKFQPLKDDVEHWCGLCFGKYQSVRAKQLVEASRTGSVHDKGEGQEKMDTSACDNDENASTTDNGTPPLLSIVSHMDQVRHVTFGGNDTKRYAAF